MSVPVIQDEQCLCLGRAFFQGLEHAQGWIMRSPVDKRRTLPGGWQIRGQGMGGERHPPGATSAGKPTAEEYGAWCA
jgi:hypothetical protein